MGLCNKLNCCTGKAESKKKDPEEKSKPPPQQQQQHQQNGDVKDGGGAPPSSSVPNGKDNSAANGNPVYAKVNKGKKDEELPTAVASPTSLPSSPSSALASPPRKAGFLVSFVVDSRGSAMTGCRGSGLRLIIPPGAVEQPVRVTCRFIRSQAHQVILDFFIKKPAHKFFPINICLFHRRILPLRL